MKKEEQVLKEIALDRIEFAVGHLRWLTREQLIALATDLKRKEPKGTIPPRVLGGEPIKKIPGARTVSHMYSISMDDKTFEHIHRLARGKRHGWKFSAAYMARFPSLEEMYEEITGKNEQVGEE